MSRNGLLGRMAPGRNYLSAPTLYDGILGPNPSPRNSFLSGLAPEPSPDNGFLSGVAGPPSSGGFLSALIADPSPPQYNGLTARLMAPPKPLFRAFHTDRIVYNFRVLSPKARPSQKHCIYAWVRDGWPVYVGKAINGANRFSGGHERLAEALALGADALWVTEVTPAHTLDETEQYLIDWCCPVLNDKHNPLSMYR